MRITILGDTMCSLAYMESFDSISAENYLKSLETIQEIKKTSDYVLLNLETPVAGKENGYVKERFLFNAPIEFAEAIKKAGTDAVMCANNHCLDRGLNGLTATINNLKKCNLEYIGIHDKKEPRYKIIDINGVKVGLLNFTYGTNAFSNGQYIKFGERWKIDMLQKQELHNKLVRKIWNNSNRYVCILKSIATKLNIGQFDVYPYERRENDFYEKRCFIKAIRECRKKADFVIVLPHVGGQYNNEPSIYTKEICRIAIKYGANAVIANHEHLIHPIEKEYLEKNKLVAYSLGNFLGVNGILYRPFDKKAEYSLAIHIDIDKINPPKFYFSIYKTVLKDNVIRTIPLYELINDTSGDEREDLLRDNNQFVKMLIGCKYDYVELKQFYEIKL